MEECLEPHEVFYKRLETAFIIASGMYLHLSKISIIELKHSRLSGLQPNCASAIFTFSILSVLAVVRPYWPAVLKKPPRFLRLLLELALTLYLTDLILRQVWVPMLRALSFICTFLSQYVVIANREIFYNQIPALAIWMRNDFFYLSRMGVALAAFCFMAEATGLSEIAKDCFKKIRNNECEDTIVYHSERRSSSLSRLGNRRLTDIDDDHSNPSSRPRRRRKARSLTRRRPRLNVGNEPEEYYC